MSSVLSDDEDRLVRIVAKRDPKKAPKKASKKAPKRDRKKAPKRAPKPTATFGRIKVSDAKGIKSKPELGDNLQNKKIVNNPPKTIKPIKPIKAPLERYTRIAGMPEESTLEPLAYELEHDQDLLLVEEKPVLNEFGQFSMSHSLSQGILWDEI